MNSQHGTLAPPNDTEVARKSVLLVEDDDAVARLFGKILQSASYDVVQAWDGNDAKRLVEETTFDAIVTDISMPSMNGIELLKVVRSRDGDVPVVLVTGKPETASAIDAVHYGALRYLVKPVKPRELRQAVAEAIEAHEMAKVKAAAVRLLSAVQS